MIPAAFDYVRADSADGAIAALGEHGDDAKLLAGGHSLLPLMKLRLAAPVGAHRHRPAVGPVLRPRRRRPRRHRRPHPPPRPRDQRPARHRGAAARHAAGQVGDPQVRHRGTIGGSIAHGDPASDLPAVLLALRATLVARGPERRARRSPSTTSSPASSRPRSRPTSCSPRSACRRSPGAGWSFQKLNRRAQDWAIVGVAVPGNGTDAGIGLVNMGSRAAARRRRRGRARRRRVGRRRRRRRRRGHRAQRRPQRQRRVPPPPRPRPRRPRPRRGRRPDPSAEPGR